MSKEDYHSFGLESPSHPAATDAELEAPEETIKECFKKLRIPAPGVEILIESDKPLSDLIVEIQDLSEQTDTEKTPQYQVRTSVTIAEVLYKRGLLDDALEELEDAATYAFNLNDADLVSSIEELIDLLA